MNIEQGVLATCDEIKAAVFNCYFASVFADEDLTTVHQPATPSDSPALVENLLITEAMVKEKLSQLKPACSPGPDNIHSRVLKEAAEQLSKPLAIIQWF